MEYFFRRRTERHFPRWLYDLVADMFAVVQYWEPSLSGTARGRRFETVFHQYCDLRGLPVTERPGSRTIRHERSASGFSHESDGVIAFPDMTVHFELKHLTAPLEKNELLVFNQKGLDHVVGGSRSLRATPFYRVILSGHILTPEARRFALQWGIAVIEPDRLPLVLLHGLAGRLVPNLRGVSTDVQDEIWSEVPALVTPLQEKMAAFAKPLGTERHAMLDCRLDRAIDYLQRVAGDRYWMTLDRSDPQWLEERFVAVSRLAELDLEKERKG